MCSPPDHQKLNWSGSHLAFPGAFGRVFRSARRNQGEIGVSGKSGSEPNFVGRERAGGVARKIALLPGKSDSHPDFSETDVGAIYDYLRTLPASRNPVVRFEPLPAEG